MSAPVPPAEALARLDAITRRLRVECPWDREQDERSIVPHTVEEAYELADAANAGDVSTCLIGSADLMPRNLDGRFEVLVPVEGATARGQRTSRCRAR